MNEQSKFIVDYPGGLMSRDLRIEYEGAFHHVINRGYHKMIIFEGKEDFHYFLKCLEEVFQSHVLILHAYCLMNNHFHLFTETPNANLSKAMHRLETKYAIYFKKKYNHDGKVFQRRYKAFLVDTNTYALDLMRYIHRNPENVIVQNSEEWLYSSYRAYLGLSDKPDFLDTNLVLNNFDIDRSKAIDKFKNHMQQEEASQWSPEDLIVGKSILGAKNFIERIKNKLPEGINTELAGLIHLKGDEKVEPIKVFISKLPYDSKLKKDLLLYGLRKKTYLNRQAISEILAESLTNPTISNRIRRTKEKATKDLKLAKVLIELDRVF